MIASFIDTLRNGFVQASMALLGFFHEKMYQEPMNEDVENFAKNLLFVGLGTFISALLSFLFNVIAGRVLGPAGYGNFTLAQSVAMILFIPMLLGFNTAMIRYCAETTDFERLRSILSTTFITVMFLTMISVILYTIFIDQLTAFFSVNPEIIWLAIIFAVLYALNTLTTSTLSGLHQMKRFAIFQPVSGLVLLASFFLFINIQPPSFTAMVYANYFAFGVVALIITFVFLRKYLVLRLDRQWLSTSWNYGTMALIGGLAFTLYSNIDRILINYYLGVESVGIYGVYYYASFAIIGLCLSIFTTVFFPTVSKTPDKYQVYKKLNKTIPYLLFFGIPGTLIGEFIILQFFGTEYPVDAGLLVLFAVSAVLVFWYTMFAWFFNADGITGVKLTVSGTLLIAIANVVLNFVLIPLAGLHGAVGATILAFALGLGYNYYSGMRYFAARHPV
jgi:O-antigen/teichoic acid export membrane protein